LGGKLIVVTFFLGGSGNSGEENVNGSSSVATLLPWLSLNTVENEKVGEGLGKLLR